MRHRIEGDPPYGPVAVTTIDERPVLEAAPRSEVLRSGDGPPHGMVTMACIE